MATAASAARRRAATEVCPTDPHDDGGRREHNPLPATHMTTLDLVAAVNQLLLAQPLVVGGCLTPPAHQVARDSVHPAAVEQQLHPCSPSCPGSETVPGAGGAPTRSKKGLRRSALMVGLQRMRRGSARVQALGLGQASTVKGQSHRGAAYQCRRRRAAPWSAAARGLRPGTLCRQGRAFLPVGLRRRPRNPSSSTRTDASIARIRCA